MADESVDLDTRAWNVADRQQSIIRGSGNCRGWNGIQYKLGMSAKNVGPSTFR